MLLPLESGPGEVERMPKKAMEPLRACWKELLLFRGSWFSFFSFAGDVASGPETALGEGTSLVCGIGGAVGTVLSFRSLPGMGGGGC